MSYRIEYGEPGSWRYQAGVIYYRTRSFQAFDNEVMLTVGTQTQQRTFGIEREWIPTESEIIRLSELYRQPVSPGAYYSPGYEPGGSVIPPGAPVPVPLDIPVFPGQPSTGVVAGDAPDFEKGNIPTLTTFETPMGEKEEATPTGGGRPFPAGILLAGIALYAFSKRNKRRMVKK